MILDDIIKNKKREVEELKYDKPLNALKKEVLTMPKRTPCFLAKLEENEFSVIAELKRKSPSKGILCESFDAVKIAKSYAQHGAAALSVLTDKKFFDGSLEALQSVKSGTPLPVLRKDFIIDEYQIWESCRHGADAILLIADALTTSDSMKFLALVQELGMDALYEVHSKKDVKKALELKPKLVGINNRDLRTFSVDIKTTGLFAAQFSKETFLVSESGIQSREDLVYLKSLGVRAALVGESLMREKDPGVALKKLLEG